MQMYMYKHCTCMRNYSNTVYIIYMYMYMCMFLCPTVQAGLVAINTALEEGDADSTLEALQNEHLDLSDVCPDYKTYYYQGLRAKKQEKAEVCMYACTCFALFV